MRRRRVIMSATLVAAAGAAVALTVPALADTSLPPGEAATLDAAATAVDPDVVAVMQRDFSLSTTDVKTRLRKERWAGQTESTLRSQVGSKFGGAWLKPDGSQLVVNVTDQASAAKVRAAGAEAKVVTTSESDLNRVKLGLDRHAAQAGQQIAGWYVDVTTSTVVVVAKPGAQNAANNLIAAAGVAPDAVRVVASEEAPRPLFDVRGADPYYIDNKARCSIGFSVVGGFVSAGHCGQVGSTTAGSNKQAQGTFKASSFPGNDYSFVQVNSNWTPTGVVNDFNGGTVPVAGSTEAAVGASVCRSGSTTGTHCGTIQAKNATVNYAEGTVTGLTRTNVCAEPGDSGGSWMSGDQAQGVTSGGSGNCTSGGTTFFQPVNEILEANNLTLVTSGSGGGGTTPPSASPSAPRPSATSARPSASASARPSASATSGRPSAPGSPSQPMPPSRSASQPVPPSGSASQPVPPSGSPSQPVPPSGTPSQPVPPSGTPSEPVPPSGSPSDPGTPPTDCTSLEASADGELSGTGAKKTVPSAGYFRARTGQHVACLTESAGANFDLVLQRWSGRRGWRTVATAASAGAGQDEHLTYTGSGGYFRYRVVSADGAGPFLLTADIP